MVEREPIILELRIPIFKQEFRPINDPRLVGMGYTINAEGEVRDKHNTVLRRVYMTHIDGAIVQLPCSAARGGRSWDTFFCKRLVEATFYSEGRKTDGFIGKRQPIRKSGYNGTDK